MPRRAFTLVETLVVVGIVAVLAAILFPVFARARVRARQATCESNLAGIGKALILYRGDHDDRLSEEPAGEGSPYFSRLPAIVAPYGVSHEVLRCPDDRYQPLPDVPADGTYFARTGSSYSYNQRLVASGREPVANPSRTLIAQEAIPFHGPPLPNGAISGVCLDGHVARVAWDDRMAWLVPDRLSSGP